MESVTDAMPKSATEEEFYLRRIHKSRFIKKNIVKAAAFYTNLHKYAVAQFFLGILIIVISSTFSLAGKQLLFSVVFIAGWAVGFTTPVTYISSSYVLKKIAFLNEMVGVIRKNEIVYLYDDCLNGVRKEKRIILAQKLTHSRNLDTYELIDNRALVKKKLHLSAESVRNFIKTDQLGLVSKISSEQLLVLESDTLIKNNLLEEAIEKDGYTFFESEKLVGLENDICLHKPLAKVQERYLVCKKLRPVSVAVGIVMIALAVVLIIITKREDFVGLTFLGFIVICLYPFFDGRAAAIKEKYEFLNSLCRNVQSREVIGIEDACMEGLSFQQRVTIIESLIASGNIAGRKLFLNKIILKSESLESEARSILENLKKKRIRAFLADNNLKRVRVTTVATNCAACGGALKENASYCTYCGRSVEKGRVASRGAE